MPCDFCKCSSEVAKVFIMLVKVINKLLRCLFLHDPTYNHLPLSFIGRGTTTKRSSKKGDPNRGQQDVSILAPSLGCSDDGLDVSVVRPRLFIKVAYLSQDEASKA